ncbi:MAG TPA: hypothetical protein VFD49_09160 [Candidatus Dormibacteraeota bacterium]|nr:hypothetical protein [Candidatus Dormibacteraeota bacterium]
MVQRFLGLAGWPALAVIAAAIVVANLLSAHRWVHRGLWLLAAATALVGAWNEWRR